jgi:hypothetical protein
LRFKKQDSIIYYAHNFKTDGLLINARPDNKSSIIDTLNYNDSIAIIQDTVKPYQLGDLTSYWVKVITHDKTGYCPIMFLTRLHLPSIKEIDNIKIKKYFKQYLSTDEYSYSENHPDSYSLKVKILLKKLNIETAFCFLYYLKFIDIQTPFPIYCKTYKNISYILEFTAKSTKDKRNVMTYLSLSYFYAGGETLIEFNKTTSGVEILLSYGMA